jgi:predicted Zn-ribbon and HTH transcriptional regulator
MKRDDNKPEVADIFRIYGNDYSKTHSLPYAHEKVMRHITACRTAKLGGHMEQCDSCGFKRNAYNSCRDRHCPKCQSLAKEKWLNDRKAELLPCGYFHVVFTLPHELNAIILCNKKVALAILFAAVSETLQAFAKDPQWRLQGQLGFIAVLHTWNQKLLDHFHVHCLVPAGALSFDKTRWVPTRDSYLFGVKSLAKQLRKRYLQKLTKAFADGKLIFPGNTQIYGAPRRFETLIQSLYRTTWIVYAKRPFAGPEQVIEYLGRYTHRVAISNNRIVSIKSDKVTFTYKDRKNNDEVKNMTLDAGEFIRRFLLHVLPNGFMKIRYFGFLANTNKKKCVPLLRKLIDPSAQLLEKITETVQDMMLRLTGEDITCCPQCQKGKMVTVATLPKATIDTS